MKPIHGPDRSAAWAAPVVALAVAAPGAAATGGGPSIAVLMGTNPDGAIFANVSVFSSPGVAAGAGVPVIFQQRFEDEGNYLYMDTQILTTDQFGRVTFGWIPGVYIASPDARLVVVVSGVTLIGDLPAMP